MPYIGKAPSSGIRSRFIYTATAAQTTFTGADGNGKTLGYTDGEYVDVYLNGVLLDPADYTATSKTSVVLDSGAAASDIVEIVVYDTFSVFNGTFTGDLTVDGDTLFVDSSADNIGIGTTSPTSRLSIFGSGGVPFRWGDTTALGTLTYSGSDPIIQSNTGNTLFYQSSTESMRIDSAGHIGIGTTSPQGDGIHIVAPDSGTGLVLSGTSATAGTEVKLSALNEATTAWHNLNIGGNNVILRAAGTEKARITTDGLTFNGDTAAANALDDYQEGTWTASLGAVTTNPTVASVANDQGVYTKIGNLVYIQWYSGAINITNAGSGIGYISGLPFSPSDSPKTAQQYAAITFTHTTAFANQIQNGYTVRSGGLIYGVKEGETNGSAWNTGSPYYIMMSGVYRTDA